MWCCILLCVMCQGYSPQVQPICLPCQKQYMHDSQNSNIPTLDNVLKQLSPSPLLAAGHMIEFLESLEMTDHVVRHPDITLAAI